MGAREGERIKKGEGKMYRVTWCDEEGNLNEEYFSDYRDAWAEVKGLALEFDYVNIEMA